MTIGDTVYVIGMTHQEDRDTYEQIKEGQIYKGIIKRAAVFSQGIDISLKGAGLGTWNISYPIRELSKVELLVECHKRKIKIEDIPLLP